MGPDDNIEHSIHGHCSNCLRKPKQQNDRNMQNPAYLAKAVETEISKAARMRIQDKGQLERDQVEVGVTCQHSERLSARHIAITQHECRARALGFWAAGYYPGMLPVRQSSRGQAERS